MTGGNAFIRRLDDNDNLMGQEHLLISRAKSEPSWEFDSAGGVLENPAMIRAGGFYHLFDSGYRWETAKYANGHAICDTPFGPCTKTSKEQPRLGSQNGMAGPGGMDFVEAPDGTLLTYMHGWLAGKVGDANGRKLWLYRIDAKKKNPTIAPLRNAASGEAYLRGSRGESSEGGAEDLERARFWRSRSTNGGVW